MKIEGTHELRAARERVAKVLTDPETLRRCMPGCERLEQTGEQSYAATLRVGIGAIKGVFNGNIRLEDLRPPECYRIVVDGRGQPGFVKGAGELELEEKGELTVVRYAGDVLAGGTLAGVGQRMLQGAARMMASQFFTALECEARASHEEPPLKHDLLEQP